MQKKVASQKIQIYAHDTVSDSAKTGDAVNITAYISKDGASPAQSNDVNPTELDSINMPGVYIFDLLQAETDCNDFVLYGISATVGISIDIEHRTVVPANFADLVIPAPAATPASQAWVGA